MTLPAAVKRAVDDWLRQGYRVRIGADGSLEVIPMPVRLGVEDLDLIEWGKK